MTKYRIVKMAGYSRTYKIEQRFFRFFWITVYRFLNLEEAESYVESMMRMDREKEENKRDMIVKEY